MRTFIVLALLVAVLGAGLGFLVGKSFALPQIESIQGFKPHGTTAFYDKDGKVFTYYALEKRILLKPEDLPFALKAAVISAEDKDFYKHGGISIPGILRALWRDVQQRRMAQGGSTITQQLSKMVFLTPEKSVRRKIEEALLAFNLEKKLSKDQILALYLNQVNLGHGNYGVGMASEFFFDKPPSQLSIDEAALLAALIRTPERDSPLKNPERALKRRNEVLRRMEANGFVTPSQYKELLERPLDLAVRQKSQTVAQYYSEEIRRYLQKKYGYDRLYKSGLKVYTTLDRPLQQHCEVALRRGLEAIDHLKGYRKGQITNVLKESSGLQAYRHSAWKYYESLEPGVLYWGLVMEVKAEAAKVRIASRTLPLEKEGFAWTGFGDLRNLLHPGDLAQFSVDDQMRLYINQEPLVQGAVVVLENSSGRIRALTGGTDFDRSEFDRAMQALRQPGSAFKPFIYAAALANGYALGDTILDVPVSLYAGPNQPMYSPQNYYREYYGIATLREALEQSYNVSAVKLFLMVGAEKVLSMAKACGIERPIPPFASSALGAMEVTPLELTAAYSTFANLGARVEPYLIERITDGEKTLERNTPKIEQRIPPAVAYLITYAMEGVIDRGTAAAAADIPIPLAGKTGTTTEYTDAWFVGFSPTYTVGVWVGNDLKKSIGPKMTGTHAALPAWMDIVRWMAAHGYEKRADFTRPTGVTFSDIDRVTGYRATPACEKIFPEAFLNGTEPEAYCSDKWHRVKQLPYYQQAPFYAFKPQEPREIALDIPKEEE